MSRPTPWPQRFGEAIGLAGNSKSTSSTPRSTSTRRGNSAARKNAGKRRKPTVKPASSSNAKADGGSAPKKPGTLSQLLTPKNLQQSVKAVGNVRSTVKNWLGYLQQADVWLDSVYSTTNSLKEAGILDRLAKSKGRKLSTEDFTTILSSILNTPLGDRMMKGLGGGADDAPADAATAASGTKDEGVASGTARPQAPPGPGPGVEPGVSRPGSAAAPTAPPGVARPQTPPPGAPLPPPPQQPPYPGAF